MDHHDHHYRRLFSQPEMLRALIVGMLPAGNGSDALYIDR